MWLNGFQEIGVEGGDEVVIVLLFTNFGEFRPWQIINDPCMIELYVRKAERDCAIRLGEEVNK